jgi:hypothetical protein
MAEQRKQPIPLKGEDLLQKVEELSHLTKRETARESGYYTLTDDNQIKVNLSEFYDALLEAKGVIPTYSSSVKNVLSLFSSPDQKASAWDIVKEVLSLHGEYGQRRGGMVRDAPGPLEGIKKTVSQWMEEVNNLFDANKVPTLHGRLLILGLHRLDPNLRKYLDEKHVGFIDAINKELQEPFKTLLKIKPKAVIPGYSADDLSGEDLLGIDPDVNTLATLIAAKTIAPPLSIGLFGNWGSGKSFFMQRLKRQVSQISKGARESELLQKDISFYKNIVQIEFNAWHYSESNLWASLVEHIFENLRISDEEDDSIVKKRQEALLNQLEINQLAREQTQKAEEDARARLNDANKELKRIQFKQKEKSENLGNLLRQGAIASLTLSDVRQVVADATAPLNITPLGNAAGELRSALREAESLLERGGKLLAPLIHGTERERNKRFSSLLWAVWMGPLVGCGIGLILWSFGAEGISQIAALTTGAATFLSQGVGWLKAQLTWASEQLSNVEKAKQKLESAIDKKQAEQAAELGKLEQELRQLEGEYQSAQRERLAAQERVDQVQTELTQTTTPRLLSQFIQERVSSNDYRQHLGILALIRRDFMKLSNLMEEDLRSLENISRLQDELLEDDGETPPSRINRIVLYIDDLDRCPAEKVVTVLQAIHLLLAFPLFVVVVGVDARWVSRSLSKHYQQLRPIGRDPLQEEIQSLGNEATPHDYIEKIFQIPFWLKPMEKDGTKHLIRGLLESSLVKKASEEADPEDSDIRRSHDEIDDEDASKLDITGISLPQSWTPTMLEIETAELLFMEQLASILGRSPRSIKRFINVYRLIKIGLSSSEAEVFLEENQAIAPYQFVMFLLAIATGLPSLSREFFRSLSIDSNSASSDEPSQDLGSIVHKFEENASQLMKLELKQLRQWLSSDEAEEWTVIKLSHLSTWAPRIARYSFRVGLS